METRIKRYFNLKIGGSKSLQPKQTKDDLAMIAVPYETTHRGRAPTRGSGPRNRAASLRTKDDLDTLPIRTFPYDTVLAGAPPIIGETPIKGNGPVKLQTSRRLSSGELLVTTQDHQRTLTDIRDGEYIVGRKEGKRVSRSLSIKLSRTSRASSPRTSFTLSREPSTSRSRQQRPKPEREPQKSPVPSPIVIHNKDRETVLTSASDIQPRSPGRNPNANKAYTVEPANVPLPMSPGQPPSNRTSLQSSKSEEQSATIQALSKAKYTRLVAIYGQDGVNRNVAELNKGRLATPREKRRSAENAVRSARHAIGPMPRHSLDTVSPPLLGNSPGLNMQDLAHVDSGSDYSSVKEVPSLHSSEEASSSCTKRTSLFESDTPTTREEVSRIVENMRNTYLKALEAKIEEKPKPKRARKAKPRASYVQDSAGPTSAPGQMSKTSTVPTITKQEKQPRQRTNRRPTPPRETTGPSVTIASKSSLKGKSQLQRADSTTLGTFLAARRESQGPPPPPSPPSPARKTKPSPDGGSGRGPARAPTDNFSRPSTVDSSATRASSSDEIAPEINDFDIFYQDLALDFGPLPPSVKPAIPPPVKAFDSRGAFLKAHDAAPPPPDINWTSRKRHVGHLVAAI